MISVVHLITLLEFGGAQGNTIHTVKTLDPSKFQAHLWCGEGAYWDNEMKASLGPQNRIRFFRRLVREVHPVFDFLVIFDLVRALKQLKPDILHTHSSKAGILGRLAGKWAGVPCVVHTFHGFGFNDRQKPWIKWFYVQLERWAATWSQRLVFVSSANMETARKLKIGNSAQYELIRSGVALNSLRQKTNSADPAQIKSSLGIPPLGRVVITISAFKPQKNLGDFLKTAQAVLRQIPDVWFVLLGDGELREHLEKTARDLQLGDKVKMPGWKKDAAEILAASDVFALTSLWEGLPRALVEAMILGRPAVCYDTDGVRDLLGKGGGLLVSQQDTSQMAEKIIQLLSDKSHWQDLSRQAIDLITNEFDIDEMVKTQETMYFRLRDHSQRSSLR